MRRSVVVYAVSVVVIVAVVVILAFGSSPRSALSPKLLSANQVPSAWLSESYQNAVKGTGCLVSVMSPKGFHETASGNVVFVNDGSVPPEVGEEITTFRSSGDAFTAIVGALQKCRKIHGDNPNSSGIYGSIVPLGLPQYGNASYAVLATITDQTITLNDDVDFIHKGKYVVEIYEANLGNVNQQQFEKFITRALSKL